MWGFLTALAPNMYSTVQQGTLRLRKWAMWLHLACLSRTTLLTVHHILLRGESHCERDHGSGPCLCFLLWCLNSTSDDWCAGVGKLVSICWNVQWSGRTEQTPPGLDITVYSTGRVEKRTPVKQPISHWTDSTQIRSFELISNNSASIVKIKATVTAKGNVTSLQTNWYIIILYNITILPMITLISTLCDINSSSQ